MLSVGQLLFWGVLAVVLAVLGKYVPFCPLGFAPPDAARAGWIAVGVIGAWGLLGLREKRWRALLVVGALAVAQRVCVVKRPAAERLAHRLLIRINDNPLTDVTNCFPTVDVRRSAGLVRFVFFDDPAAGASTLVFTDDGTERVRNAVGSAAVPEVYDGHWYWQVGRHP